MFRKIEYNTDALGGTFERLTRIEALGGSEDSNAESVKIDAKVFERTMIRSLQRAGDQLVTNLSSKAVNRVLRNERLGEIGPAALISEVVTEKSIRKGFISEAGRYERCCQISHAIKQNGEVEFAILLLPFRTSTPLKNRGTLPDMGEFYTLILLYSLSRACHVAQMKMAKLIEDVAKRVGDGARECAQSTAADETCGIKHLLKAAIQECEKLIKNPKECAATRKLLRKAAANPPGLQVNHEPTFVRLLVELAVSSIPIRSWFSFKDAPVIPVRILACRDAGRYPCFDTVSLEQIAAYRAVLSDALEAFSVDQRFFRLVDYAEIKKSVQDTSGHKEAMRYYAKRKAAFLSDVERILPAIWSARGRDEMHKELSEIDPEGVLRPLFEPILFSLEHSCISDAARQTGLDEKRLYVEAMQTIYLPQDDEKLERLRRQLIEESLRGAILYCSAYEANTGSKNPVGFDDVAAVFPNALRMSIHQKPESSGHFTIHVSPTRKRTPWHGTATLTTGRTPDEICIAIDLAEYLELTGARGVVVYGNEGGLLARHIRARQPVVYLSPTISASDAQALVELLESASLVASG
ncbi:MULTISPECIES: L-tyrosine/L-tryptophan isonitrile synthase family protein [unclassified Bradyrhizobium]|uniref:L-tyrosine/L-tryptophan isonitrile synthase family protein n=1 Tax=unclassified Bradyrhizobium TaxID=2631580 RepID=UPI002479C571|nr:MULTISPECIES: L-tyrosine/L-tryptophan isonitrile synthase family protein [unclassified Bradyrhizobium]WGS19316.1 L-tyrosine/L-tryptophan isonitrile synthase family protein [Bradyrhizobium sp. ISRA463]WGS26151.1 L-tyrosine/L-tryptophan isonitrile synthase family protein [Bradyrhizobium sp. ISRA464]